MVSRLQKPTSCLATAFYHSTLLLQAAATCTTPTNKVSAAATTAVASCIPTDPSIFLLGFSSDTKAAESKRKSLDQHTCSITSLSVVLPPAWVSEERSHRANVVRVLSGRPPFRRSQRHAGRSVRAPQHQPLCLLAAPLPSRPNHHRAPPYPPLPVASDVLHSSAAFHAPAAAWGLKRRSTAAGWRHFHPSTPPVRGRCQQLVWARRRRKTFRSLGHRARLLPPSARRGFRPRTRRPPRAITPAAAALAPTDAVSVASSVAVALACGRCSCSRGRSLPPRFAVLLPQRSCPLFFCFQPPDELVLSDAASRAEATAPFCFADPVSAGAAAPAPATAAVLR